MKKTRADMMLKISSILMLILGTINLIVSLLGVWMGSQFVSMDTGEKVVFTNFFDILIIVISILMCVNMLLCGIFGVIGKKLVFCQGLSFLLLLLTLINLLYVIGSGVFEWYALLPVVLPVFYCYAVWAVRKERGKHLQ